MRKLLKKINSYVPNFISRNFGRKVLALVMALFVFWKVSQNWKFYWDNSVEKNKISEFSSSLNREERELPIFILIPPNFEYKISLSQNKIMIPFDEEDIRNPKAFVDLTMVRYPGEYYKNVAVDIKGKRFLTNYKVLAKVTK